MVDLYDGRCFAPTFPPDRPAGVGIVQFPGHNAAPAAGFQLRPDEVAGQGVIPGAAAVVPPRARQDGVGAVAPCLSELFAGGSRHGCAPFDGKLSENFGRLSVGRRSLVRSGPAIDADESQRCDDDQHQPLPPPTSPRRHVITLTISTTGGLTLLATTDSAEGLRRTRLPRLGSGPRTTRARRVSRTILMPCG